MPVARLVVAALFTASSALAFAHRPRASNTAVMPAITSISAANDHSAIPATTPARRARFTSDTSTPSASSGLVTATVGGRTGPDGRYGAPRVDGAGCDGCHALAERARRELRASGEASRRRRPEAWATLTPQEMQIALLAVEGLSNREIGERLYLSHRTVGSHLYRLFRSSASRRGPSSGAHSSNPRRSSHST